MHMNESLAELNQRVEALAADRSDLSTHRAQLTMAAVWNAAAAALSDDANSLALFAVVAAGIPVTYLSYAAVAQALDTADVVLVGADAIAATWFLNKTGTRMLAAAATQQGVPVYVVAGRDKFVGREMAERLVIRSGEPGEVWDSPPQGVDVRNPYFELIPLDLVTAVISDVGILGTGMIPDVCEH